MDYPRTWGNHARSEITALDFGNVPTFLKNGVEASRRSNGSCSISTCGCFGGEDGVCEGLCGNSPDGGSV